MSDGPHRSLGLRKPWRQLAKLCDNAAYAQAEVTHAATSALVSDFNEVSGALLKAIKRVFDCEGNSLGSPEIAMYQLNLARSLAAGSVFGQNAVKCSQMLVSEGKLEPESFDIAIGVAAKMRGQANLRAFHEHYLEKTSEFRANKVVRRFQEAIDSLSIGSLGNILVEARTTRIRPTTRSTGLDEGVRL